jgi:hypothetical protein
MRIFAIAVSAAMVMGLAFTAQASSHGKMMKDKGLKVEVSQEMGDVKWVLPGPRRLDPALFGTPANPKGTGHDVGVPLKARGTDEAGKAYTMTTIPTPFSDKAADISGSFEVEAWDRTPKDTPKSKDKAKAEFDFTSPGGKHSYRVVLKKVIPVGPHHPFGGGVIADDKIHGVTGIGTRMEPTQYAYAAFWGVGQLWRDGEKLAGNRVVHFMATEQVRGENFKLLFDQELPHQGIQAHLMLPNEVVTKTGPATKPVPTGFTLPNGKEQPFIHVMFLDPDLEGLPLMK